MAPVCTRLCPSSHMKGRALLGVRVCLPRRPFPKSTFPVLGWVEDGGPHGAGPRPIFLTSWALSWAADILLIPFFLPGCDPDRESLGAVLGVVLPPCFASGGQGALLPSQTAPAQVHTTRAAYFPRPGFPAQCAPWLPTPQTQRDPSGELETPSHLGRRFYFYSGFGDGRAGPGRNAL